MKKKKTKILFINVKTLNAFHVTKLVLNLWVYNYMDNLSVQTEFKDEFVVRFTREKYKKTCWLSVRICTS